MIPLSPEFDRNINLLEAGCRKLVYTFLQRVSKRAVQNHFGVPQDVSTTGGAQSGFSLGPNIHAPAYGNAYNNNNPYGRSDNNQQQSKQQQGSWGEFESTYWLAMLHSVQNSLDRPIFRKMLPSERVAWQILVDQAMSEAYVYKYDFEHLVVAASQPPVLANFIRAYGDLLDRITMEKEAIVDKTRNVLAVRKGFLSVFGKRPSLTKDKRASANIKSRALADVSSSEANASAGSTVASSSEGNRSLEVSCSGGEGEATMDTAFGVHDVHEAEDDGYISTADGSSFFNHGAEGYYSAKMAAEDLLTMSSKKRRGDPAEEEVDFAEDEYLPAGPGSKRTRLM